MHLRGHLVPVLNVTGTNIHGRMTSFMVVLVVVAVGCCGWLIVVDFYLWDFLGKICLIHNGLVLSAWADHKVAIA